MPIKFRMHSHLTAAALSLALIGLLPGCGPKAPTVDAVGTWKLAANPHSQVHFEPTLKIRMENGHLAGTLNHRGTARVEEQVIEHPKVEGDELFFTITIPPPTGSGPGTVRKYHCKISGDMMQGKCDVQWAGQPYTRDWEAKRVKP